MTALLAAPSLLRASSTYGERAFITSPTFQPGGVQGNDQSPSHLSNGLPLDSPKATAALRASSENQAYSL